MKVLWLASWYPNKYEPVNGDFVQRHANAVASIMNIDVIHVVQLGKDVLVEDGCSETQYHNLYETVYSFSFRKLGIDWFDKIRYNIKYRSFYLKVLQAYIQQNGKPDIIHVHVPMKAGLVAMQMKQLFSIPYIVSEQASYYETAAPDTFYKRSIFFRKSTKQVFRNAIIATNVSNTIGNQIKQMFQLKKVVPIHNVVNTSHFFYKPLVKNDIFKWIHVSTLGEQKNIEGLIAAFQQLNHQKITNWQLTLIGPYKNHHLQLIEDAGLKNQVFFTGEIAHHNVAVELQKANAFVLFSKHENFPCVIPEALCCGLPIVASEVGGIAEAIDETNGLIVTSGNINMLSESLENLMKNYSQYNQISIAETANIKYNYTSIGNQFVQIYNEVLA